MTGPNGHNGSNAVPKAVGYHGAVSEFKRRLIEATLCQLGGNRTRAARALGLQRTYLLRLIREFGVDVPPPPGPGTIKREASPPPQPFPIPSPPVAHGSSPAAATMKRPGAAPVAWPSDGRRAERESFQAR